MLNEIRTKKYETCCVLVRGERLDSDIIRRTNQEMSRWLDTGGTVADRSERDFRKVDQDLESKRRGRDVEPRERWTRILQKTKKMGRSNHGWCNGSSARIVRNYTDDRPSSVKAVRRGRDVTVWPNSQWINIFRLPCNPQLGFQRQNSSNMVPTPIRGKAALNRKPSKRGVSSRGSSRLHIKHELAC